MQLSTTSIVSKNKIKIDPYHLDLESMTFYENDILKKIPKTLKKAAILLFKNQGQVVSNEQLIVTVWEDGEANIQKVRDLIYRLRKEFPKIRITNHSNTGYCLQR